jgi:hypothetical protein
MVNFRLTPFGFDLCPALAGLLFVPALYPERQRATGTNI